MPKKMKIIYHKNCTDGFCCAWLLHKRYPDAEFIASQYYEDAPNVKGYDVIIADFSYKRHVIEKMIKEANSFILMDHHKTAIEELEGIGGCVLDLSKSGAGLVWDFLEKDKYFKDNNFYWIVDYVQDRDLWNFKLHNSRYVNAFIRSFPETFEAWDEMAGLNQDLASDYGIPILRTQEKIVTAICQKPASIQLDGYSVPCINSGTFQSEIGEKLLENNPDAKFSVIWFLSHDKTLIVGLRSRKDFDCSRIAKIRGGGGHKGAAGFKIKYFTTMDFPWRWIPGV